MKQSHWLLCITRNCDWSRKITPLSNLTQMASREMKTYSESRIELRNLQILKKMLEKSTQFLSSEQPCGPKSLNVSLNIAGVERIHSENMRLGSTLDAIWFEFEWKEGYWRWKFVSSVVSDSQISLTWYRRHRVPPRALWLQHSWPRAVVSYTFLAVVPWSGLEHSCRKVRL